MDFITSILYTMYCNLGGGVFGAIGTFIMFSFLSVVAIVFSLYFITETYSFIKMLFTSEEKENEKE